MNQTNYFDLLGLNPDDTWDETKFKDALRKKRIEWTAELPHPIKGLNAQKKLESLAIIQKVMENPTERQAQAMAAKAAQASGHQARLEEFEKQLAFINVKDSIDQSELDKFIDDFKGVLTAKEIKDRVQVSVKTSAPSSLPPPQFDLTIIQKIAQLVSFLNLATLYQFLGGDKGATTADLSRAAERIHADMIRRQPKDAEVTAKGELAGLAKTVFQSDATRRMYFDSLQQAELGAFLDDVVKMASRSPTKEVQVGQVMLFLQAVKKAGWNETIAITRLKELARQRGLSVQIPTDNPNAQKIRCSICHNLNNQGQNFCSNCHHALYITCPDCNQKVLTGDSACGKCGFMLGNSTLVDSYLVEIETLFNSGALLQAQDIVADAEAAWQPKKPDQRRQKLTEFKTKLDSLIRDQQKRLQKLDEELRELMSKKMFFATQQRLTSPDSALLPNRDVLKRSIDESIEQAKEQFKQARSAHTSYNDKIEYCRNALRMCADYTDAQALLKTMPPTPPGKLTARVRGTVVSLSWQPSPTPDITYSIVRKRHSQPISASDGKVLDRITALTFEDTTPESGLPLYYAVYAEYDTVVSHQGALLTQPVLIKQDVLQDTVDIQIDDRVIALTWDNPRNIHSIVVVRKEQTPPTSISDGLRIAEISKNQADVVDRAVQNDHTYYYGIFCQYKDHEGHLSASSGTFVHATPEKPPTAVTEIDIKEIRTPQGYDVEICWTPPEKGHVVILRSDKPMPLSAGKDIQEAQLHGYGQKLPGHANYAIDSWTGSGVAYYTPVVISSSRAYIGVCHRYTCTENVSNLISQNLGTVIRLKWSWPENCQEVRITYSSHDWPQPGDSTATLRRMSRAEYDHIGYYDLRGTLNQRYFIIVSAIIKQGEEELVAQGERIQGRIIDKMIVIYEVKNPTLLRRKRTLCITTRTAGSLPTLLLISQRDRLPFTKADGDLLFRVEPTLIGGKELEIEIPKQSFPPKTYCKLFLEDAQMNEVVNIMHPDKDHLRLQ